MDLRAHRVPTEVFSGLAGGGGGATAVRHLAAAQYSKHVLLVRQVVESAGAAGHEQAALARRGYELLAAVQDREPDAVDAVLRHPPVGAWARHTILTLDKPGTSRQAAPGQLAGLAVAAAIRAGADCTPEVPGVDGAVMLPSVGRLDVPAHAARDRIRVSVVGGRAKAVGSAWSLRIPADPSTDLASWQGLHRLSATAAGKRLDIVIEDLDAWRMPGTANLGQRLSWAEAQGWQSALDAAWDLLAGHHPVVAAEVAAAIRVFTPLIPPSRGLVSATSRETFGTIALSQPPDACSLAVTMAHETQHAKLSALLDIVPMLLPDDGRRYYAPWRNDPRPLSGLFQGAYAFLGVAGFWRRQRAVTGGDADPIEAHTEFARWRDAARLVAGTLTASGRLTAAGEVFVAGMARTLRGWAAEPVPADAAIRARRLADEHRARWIRENGQAAAQV